MTLYHIYKDNLVVGPLSDEAIIRMLAEGTMTDSTLCRKMPDGEWLSASQLFDIPSSDEMTTVQETERKEDEAIFIRRKDENECVFACPSCGQKYSTPFATYAGRQAICGKCNFTFSIPEQLPEEQELPPKIDTADFAADIPNGELLCPHCWKSFDSDNLLYIAVHPSLTGDPVLGDFVQQRFKPSTFNVQGHPLDECGLPATDTACPRCHLEYPLGMIDNPTLYFSIAGATSSGKSYFLTGMVHKLRQTLPRMFNTGFYDLSPKMNETLSNYEKQIYMSLEPDKLTALPATQISGEGISDRVLLDGIEIELPKPFVFTCRPVQEHSETSETNLVLYDNSGEMFIPGRDEWGNQATFHLSHSNGIMFLFDPTNDANMRREICDEKDPQVSQRPRAVDQVILFNEMLSRIRRHANMANDDICETPLIVVIGKYDTWADHFPKDLSKLSPIIVNEETLDASLDMDMIADVSFAARQLIQKYVPSLVDTAERFFSSVFFIPVSTFGTMAEMSPTGFIGIVPSKMSPIWLDIPALTLLQQNDFLKASTRKNEAPAEYDFQAKMQGKQIIFKHPTTGEIVRLPGNYAGRRLTIGGKYYDLPRSANHFAKKVSANPWK